MKDIGCVLCEVSFEGVSVDPVFLSGMKWMVWL